MVGPRLCIGYAFDAVGSLVCGRDGGIIQTKTDVDVDGGPGMRGWDLEVDCVLSGILSVRDVR
jgi:hypothetical protein